MYPSVLLTIYYTSIYIISQTIKTKFCPHDSGMWYEATANKLENLLLFLFQQGL